MQHEFAGVISVMKERICKSEISFWEQSGLYCSEKVYKIYDDFSRKFQPWFDG